MKRAYIFDTSSFNKMKHYYPAIFETVWSHLDSLVSSGLLISTKEVWTEVNNGSPTPHLIEWLNDRKNQIFTTPNREELLFVAEIFKVKHFQTLIGNTQKLRGTPVADPFLIACAKIHNGILITEESYKHNSSKIPNVCEYFDVEYMNFEELMLEQKWKF